MQAQPASQLLPLFGPAAPPPQRADLAGWHYGDPCLLHDPKNPGHWRKARVIGVSPRAHLLTLRAQSPDAIVQLNPITHAHMLRRPTGPSKQGPPHA
jgi:hypothetical protein